MNTNEALSIQSIFKSQDVLLEVSAMLLEIIGEEYVGELEIGMETSFSKELELESIELVALAEKLRSRYADLDLAAWLGTMELEQIINLKVGDLVEQIVQCTSAHTTV